jgi:hypothetical protein
MDHHMDLPVTTFRGYGSNSSDLIGFRFNYLWTSIAGTPTIRWIKIWSLLVLATVLIRVYIIIITVNVY